MMRKLISIFVPLILLVPLFSSASQNYNGIFCRETAWDKVSSASLFFSDEEIKKIHYEFGKKAIQITLHKNKNMYPLILIEPGIYIYPKKLESINGHSFEPFEAFMAQLKVITYIFHQAFPTGPTSIQGKKSIDMSDRTKNVEFVVDPATVGLFDAPWSVKGYIEKLNQNTYQFVLTFNYRNHHTHEAITKKLNGELKYSDFTFHLPDSYKLEKFTIFSLKNSKIHHINSIYQLKKYLNSHENQWNKHD